MPMGGYDSDFYFVVLAGCCLIDTVPNLGDEIDVGVCSNGPKLLLPLLLWVPKLLRPAYENRSLRRFWLLLRLLDVMIP